jgi:hypothetical protein
LLRQLQQFFVTNWMMDDVKMIKNQFVKFMGLPIRTARCEYREWPVDPTCRRRQTSKSTSRCT